MLEFANPFALFLLFATPALILAYRRRKSEKTQTVSSLIILKHLSKKAVPKKRIKLPLRFYFELAALIALVAAIALPINKTKKIAVLFDNSLSMAAKDKKSRLDLALEKFNEEKTFDSSYDIYSASPRLVQSDTNLKTTFVEDRLLASIKELSQNSKYDKLWIFSDKKIKTEEPRVRTFLVGSPIGNLYFEHLSINNDQEIKIKIAASTSKKIAAKISLYAVDLSDKIVKQIDSKEINISSNLELDFQGEKETIAYRIEIKADDAIKEDNTAWLISKDDISSKILLVSDQNSGLEQIPGIKVTQISFSDFAKLENYKIYSLIIFHHCAPATVPSIPSLLILPPNQNNFFPSKEKNNIKISSWNENHPISSYLRADLLNIKSGIEFIIPNWAESIISGEHGGIIAAGQQNGTLIAASGLELLPYEGRKTPALSILTVNLIKWLTNKIGVENVTGEKFKVEANSVVIKPNQEIIKNKESNIIDLDAPGIYLISKQGALAVNTIHSKESNTNNIEEISISDFKKVANQKESKVWKYLVYSAIALLFLEMLIRRFKDDAA